MHKQTLSFIGMLATAGFAACADGPENELKALQGSWAPVAYESCGARYSKAAYIKGFGEEEWQQLGLRIAGDNMFLGTADARKEFAYRRDGKPKAGTWHLDPSGKRKTFELNTRGGFLSGGPTTWTLVGIYRIEKGRLEVCCVFSFLDARPMDFDTAPESWRVRVAYERVKAADKE